MREYIGWLIAGIVATGLIDFVPQPAQAEVDPETSIPHWIRASSHDGQPVDLLRSFTVDAPVQQATLKFAADFCFATVAINETEVLEVAPFVQLQTLNVTNAVQRGENRLRVRLREGNRLTGVALSLEIRYANGTSAMIVSDAAWWVGLVDPTGVLKTTPLETEKLLLEDRGAVAPELWGIGRRDISLSAFENYEQWQQSKGEVADKHRPQFWLAPGFEITELRVAQPDEGSWIAMAFDDKGRLTISREDVGLLRMTLAEDRKSVARVEKVEVPLEECRGLAYDGETLYANANNSKAMFRLKIDDEGKPQDVTKLREFPGGVGHGRNDIALRRDRVYSIHGDSVEQPIENGLDWTSPNREFRSTGSQKEGLLVRVDPNFRQAEIMHAGLRNPYGIALNSVGDPFTFDADNEHDMGTPWYRPTRILQLIDGGDSGYREVTGQLPPRFHDQPDHAPPLFDIGRSSPTSVMFGDELKFPMAYQRALFALDWTYGRIIAVHLAPRGLTYRVNAETFLQGRPLNVTDIGAGPDGAIYLTTGGRKTQSALYRVAWTGQEVHAAEPSQHESECSHAAENARSPRGLWYYRGFVFPRGFASPDPVERHNAVLEEERKRHLLRHSTKVAQPLISGLIAARSRQTLSVPTALKSLASKPLPEQSLTDQFIWVRIANLCLETSRDEVLAQRDQLIPLVLAAWKALDARPYSVAPEGTSVELRRRLAYLLGELGADELPKLASEKLLSSGVQEDQIAGLLALRNQKTGWTLELRRQQFATINSISLMIGGAGLPPLEKWLREESIKTLTDDEKAALGDMLQPKPPEPEPLPPPRPLVQKWTLDALVSLHTSDGPQGDAERGRLLFREALCSRCHRVGLRGAAVGPDLTHVSRRFNHRDILESILSPNLSVAEQFRQEAIETHSGQTHIGRIIPEGDYRKETIRLATDPLDINKFVEIDKKEIAEHKSVPTSPMPSGLLDSLTMEEIRDLLAYLASGEVSRP
ncbi:MAG: hypothetical protein DWH91_09005 [Planctomycetota bacterium]|nr:MAG: hypothetical protein DWH91_09005 [Planctomycetota bacterium]